MAKTRRPGHVVVTPGTGVRLSVTRGSSAGHAALGDRDKHTRVKNPQQKQPAHAPRTGGPANHGWEETGGCLASPWWRQPVSRWDL